MESQLNDMASDLQSFSFTLVTATNTTTTAGINHSVNFGSVIGGIS